jgi:hypothetical protein
MAEVAAFFISCHICSSMPGRAGDMTVKIEIPALWVGMGKVGHDERPDVMGAEGAADGFGHPGCTWRPFISHRTDVSRVSTINPCEMSLSRR